MERKPPQSAALLPEPQGLEAVQVPDRALPRDPIIVAFFVDGIPPLPNSVSKAHWKAAAANKKEWTGKVRTLALKTKQLEHLEGLYDYAEVHFHISVGSNRRTDPDNLIWAVAKPALDGLQGVFLKDDSIDAIKLGFTFDRVKPRGFLITISGR